MEENAVLGIQKSAKFKAIFDLFNRRLTFIFHQEQQYN